MSINWWEIYDKSHDDRIGLLVIHDFKFVNRVDSMICSQALYFNMYQVLLL